MFPIVEPPLLSSPLLEPAIAGIKTLARTTITPRNTKYEVQITAIYEPIARFLSPSKNFNSLESFAAVTRISEIFQQSMQSHVSPMVCRLYLRIEQ